MHRETALRQPSSGMMMHAAAQFVLAFILYR